MESLAERTRRLSGQDTPAGDAGGVAQIDDREQAIIDRYMSKAPGGDLAARAARLEAQEEINARRKQRSYAENAAPETVDPTREMLSNLGDRGKVLETLRKLTPEQRSEALKLAPGIAQQLGDDRGGGVARTLGAVSRGISHMVSQPVQELIGMGGTNDEIEYIRQLDAAASQEFNPALPSDPWYERGPLQAIEMVPWMATIVGGGGLGRAAASGVAGRVATSAASGSKVAGAVQKAGQAIGNLPTKVPVVGKYLPGLTAGRAGELAGITSAAFPGQYAQEVDQLKAIGMQDDAKLRLLAGGTAAVVGLIEGLVPNPLKAGPVPLNKGAVTAARQYLWEAAKRAPAEMSEEYLQGVTSGLGQHVAQYIDANAKDKTIADAFALGWEQTKEAALPMAFLLGAPASIGAGRAALQARTATQERLALLEEIRSKGFVSINDASNLNIEGKNRKDRLANLDKEIEALKNPSPWNDEFLAAENARLAAEQGQPPSTPTADPATLEQSPLPSTPPIGTATQPGATLPGGEISQPELTPEEAAKLMQERIAQRRAGQSQTTTTAPVPQQPKGGDPTVTDAEQVPPSTTTPQGKEPWELTRSEHVAERERRIAEFRRLSDENGGGPEAMKVPEVAEAFRAQEEWSDLDIGHKPSVQKAVKDGKPVPASVLAEYPNIKPKSILNPVPVDAQSKGTAATPTGATVDRASPAADPISELDQAEDELAGLLGETTGEDEQASGDVQELPQPKHPDEVDALPKDSLYRTTAGGKKFIAVRGEGKRGGGDRLFETVEAANAHIERQKIIDQQNEEVRKKREEREAAESKQEADYVASFQGFKQDNPREFGRARKVLDTQRNYRDKVQTRKQIIEQSVADGAKVLDGRLERPDGTSLGEDAITKIGIQYAEHLIAARLRSDAAKADLRGDSEMSEALNRQADKLSNPESKWQTETRAKLDAVPALKGSKFDMDEKAGRVNVTRPDGLKATIHFNADEELAKAAIAKGKKPESIHGRAVRRSETEFDIYVRSDANHTNILNHEVMHWLEFNGVVTKEEVEKYGGREAIAEKYGKWAEVKLRKKDSVFQRIYDALEAVFSSQRKFFEEVGERKKTSENSKNDTARPAKSSELDSNPGTQPKGVGSSALGTGAVQPASEQAWENLRDRGKRNPYKRNPSQADLDAETAAVLREREADNKVRQEFKADRDAQKAQDSRREFVGEQKSLANPATVDSMSVGDIAQVNDDISRGRISYEDAVKVGDAFVAAGYLPQGKRDQIRKPQESLSQNKKPSVSPESAKGTNSSPIGDDSAQSSADQVNVDSGEESKVKPEDELASLRAKSERMYDEVERLQNAGKDREANALLREAEKLTPRIKELEAPLIKAKQDEEVAAKEESRKAYNAKEDARKAALPTKQTRNGWELATDGARWYLRDPNTKEIIYEGKMQRVREVADESKPDVPQKPELAPEKQPEEQASKPLPEPETPKFTRTTPDKGSTTRTFQSERVDKARADIAELEKKARAKRSEHDSLRSNATKKRAAVRKEIESFNRMIQKTQGEIASDMAADTLAKLEDELESPRSYDHYLAGMKAIHKLKASVAEDAARRGEMGREAARSVVSKEEREADRLDAELEGRAKDIAMSKGFTSGDAEQIALAASNGFTVFEDRSLADVVEVQGKRTRESRVSQEISKLKPSSPYGQKDLSNDQVEDFTKQYQEASLDDKNWLAKRGEVDKAVKEAINANREASRKREDEERKAKEAEKAKDEQEALANARERAKKYFLDERISKALKKQKPKTKSVKIRQESDGGPVKIVEGKTIDGDQDGELYPNGLILHKTLEEDSKDFVLTHARSGSGFPFSAKKSDMQELIGLLDILGLDFNVDTDEKGALPSELTSRVKKINTAWDNGDYATLSEQDYATVKSLAEVAKTDIDADLILTADDLGANGIPPGLDKVFTDRGLRVVKGMAEEVPEFAYDPVFTVKDGMLLYRDGYEFNIDPTAFNLHPSELKEGQTVGINLEDLGINRATPQDVVAEVMKGTEIPRVTKTKGGAVSVGYVGARPTTLQQGESDNDWSVVGGTPKVQEIAVAALKKIRWRQPGQDGDPKTDIDVVPVEKESVVAFKNESESDIVTPLDPVKRIENVIEQGRATGREPSKAMLEKLDDAKEETNSPMDSLPENGYIEGPKGGKLSKPQFEVGERIQVGNSQGVVESVNLRWSGTGPKGSAYKDSYKVRFDSGDLANAGSLSMDGNDMKKAASVEPVTETPKPIPAEVEFMEMSVGVNAPGVNKTIRVTAGDRTLLMERSKHDSEWSIREGEKYTGEVKGKNPVKTKSAILASGIVETKKAKEIAQRIIDGTYDKDYDKRFVREDTQNIGLTNAGLAEAMKGALGGRRDSFAKLLRENNLVTDGRLLLKVNDKDRDAILKGVGETFEGRSLGVVAQMMTDGQKALSRSANAMKPIGYRGGYLTPRTVVLQSQDGDSAIIDKSLHDTILKKYPNAVPYFLEDGKPISYAVDGDLVAIVMPMNMDKPDAKVKDLVAGKYDFDAEAAEAAKFPPPQPKTKLKKAAEKANKELSNAVDEFGNAIKGKLGMNLPLNPEVIAAAAKVVTKAIEAGVRNFAELMERMVTKYGEKMAKRMEAALQQEWDKQVNARPYSEDGTPPTSPQPHPELVPPEPIPMTSVKNAIVDELRIQRGETPMPDVTPQTVQQWLEVAGNRIANDPYAGNTLVEQLLTGGKTSVDEMEGMVLQYHYRAVNNLFVEADIKLRQAKANGDPALIATAQDEARVIMRRLTAVETALDKAGTAWGRAGVSRQIFLKQDFSLASMVRRARVANGGNELSDEQVAKISEQAKQIEEMQKRIAELEAKTAEQEQAKVIDEAIKKDIENIQSPPAKPKSKMRLKAEERVASALAMFGAAAKGKLYTNPIDPEVLIPAIEVVKAYFDLGVVTFREFMSTIAKNIGAKEAKASKAIFRTAWDQLQTAGALSQPDLDLTNPGKLTRFARSVQRTLIENGIREREEIVDGVHEALQEIIPDITRRQAMDALSSYGQFSQLSKDPIDQIMRDINGQLQQLAKLEDMEQGIAPAKTGVERRLLSDEERRLAQMVNEATRRGGFVVTDPETQLKSAMAAAKTAVRNRIADMNFEIQTGSRIVRGKTELIPDAELEQLRKDRDALQQVHKEMFPPKGATQAQKIASASRALDAAIASLEAKLAVGDISPAPQPPPLSTPELDAKRARLKALNEQRDALRKIANPGMTAEQIKIRSLNKSIAELEKQLATGNFAPNPKPAPLTSPEINARQAKLEELRATKKAILAAANPKMTPEQRARKAYEASLRKQLAMYSEKIAQGDFAPAPKKSPRILTNAELDLKKQLADIKHDFFEALSKYHLANLSPAGRAIDIVRESAHLSRAIMTSVDLSAVLRQGGLGVYSHPKMARKAAAEMWNAIWSRQAEFQSMEKLRTRPNAQLYEESGLNITDSEGKLSRQEEAFMGRWARTGIDFLGGKVQAGSKLALEPVAASARAYVTFINNLRADLFDVMVENLGRSGQVTKEEARLIATYVNAATGRADLKALNEKAAALNTVFFAPRYVASRFQYLAMPLYLLGSKDSIRVKKLIAKEYARTFTGAAVFIASLTALSYLAYLASGDDDEKPSLEINPLSADFFKPKIGETRIDPLAGLAQVIVFSSRMLSFHTKSSETGKIKRFYEGGPYETTHGSEAWRFMRTKLAPVPGAAVTAMSGMKDVVGDPVTPAGLVGGLFVPISLGEVYSTMRHRGIPKGTALTVLNIMGASVNTYGPKTAYLDATPEDRAKQVNDYIKHMDWESDLPAFSEYLKPEELKQVQDRQNERRGDLVFEAMGEVKPKKDYKTEVHYEEALERHKKANEEFEEFRKQYAPTYTDALRYLTYHFDNEGGIKSQGLRKAKPSFVERKSRLMKYYESRP